MTTRTRTILAAAALLVGCAADTDATGAEATDDELLAEVCADGGGCGDGKADGSGPTEEERGLFAELRQTLLDAQDAYRADQFEAVQAAYLSSDLVCPYPERFSHFVDRIDSEASTFTSVQELLIETDRSPEEVLENLRTDWDWWHTSIGDASVPQTVGEAGPDESFRVDIRPLGLPLVNIEMTVPPVQLDCSRPEADASCIEQPPLETAPQEAWDAGVQIDMAGNAFQGTFYMFARREGDVIRVREMWYHTRAVSTLVRVVLAAVESAQARRPILRPRSTPNVGVFLHLLATQGCVPFMSGTGYPGLIDRVEGRN